MEVHTRELPACGFHRAARILRSKSDCGSVQTRRFAHWMHGWVWVYPCMCIGEDTSADDTNGQVKRRVGRDTHRQRWKG